MPFWNSLAAAARCKQVAACARQGTLFCGFLLPVLLSGQTVAIPNSGVIYDAEARSLRPINGIAGSATLGPPLNGTGNIAAAAVCSPKHFALTIDGDSSAVNIFRLDRTAAVQLPAGTMKLADQVVLSPSCSAGLLFSSATGQVQAITGLPNVPVLTADFTVSLTGISSFAISDDGVAVVCVAPADALYSLSASNAPQTLTLLHGGAGVAFMSGYDLLVADTDGNRIMMLTNVLGALNTQTLAGAEGGLSLPVSVAFNAAKQTVLIGNGGTSEIGMLHMADGKLDFLGCGCAGTFSFLGDEVFEVAAPSDELPLLLLDAKSSPAKVLFVPVRQ